MPDAPSSLGPFRLTRRRQQTAAGEVYDALGPDGRTATVVLLAPGPATDAAARDRFAAAVAGAGRDGEVLLDASAAPRPWAALTDAPQAPDRVLGPVLPVGAVGAAASGPGFEPYWRDAPGAWRPPPAPAPAGAASAQAAGSESAARAGTGRWVAVAVVGSIALVLAGLLGWRALLGDGGDPATLDSSAEPNAPVLPTLPQPEARPRQPQPQPQPQQSLPESTSAPPGPGTAPPAPAVPREPQRPLETSGPGVAGPSFVPDDDTREMRLAGLPFAFRVPVSWECERDEDVPEPVVRYRCHDRSDPADEDPAGGVVEVVPCPPPCGAQAWETLRARYAPLPAWRPVDAQTAVLEHVPATRPGGYEIRMSRIFSSVPDRLPDTHVFVQMTGAAQDVETLQKVVNDIRANTS